ncbi:MAG: TonB-dependent receptor [Undibacterium sp.]|uniref:TonB-dependent receptor plug domain-containing protein n=1 Tax=Undibacterium sp. TaxID=1914977 RepID=UPI002721E2E6|nr:TonB-dependent receptor [Undibacterium sp.]MDO8650816.1 TonB-dependent receptor [Undibacterium sp.]
MTIIRKAVLLALYGATSVAAVTPAMVFAQAAAGADKTAEPAIQTTTIIGSRRANTSATDTPLPIDFISMSKVAEQGGQFDLAQTLQYISPSFNSTRQTGADGADLVDSAALRGLGSDQTLVLVNGKRHHTTALVNLFGARNRGNTGTDLNTIPMMAISNIQILRDGAAAQYGSDAIAGVMDIGLKKSLGCEAVFGYSQYSVGDGKSFLPSAYCGIEIGNKGVLGITVEYNDRGRSNRAEPGNPRTIGDTKVQSGAVYLNGELPNGGADKFYFTLGTQQRKASSAAWARNGTDDIPAKNSAAMYPDGFVPYINGDINDVFGTFGYRWQMGEWRTDLSQTIGYNELKYNVSNTLNASMANKDLLAGGKGLSPNRFDAGGFSFGQATTNLDFSRFFDGFMNGVNVAFGGEYRRENYKIFAGEPGSYIDADGVGFGGNAGSQGFPGFQPGDSTDRSRNSLAAYVDIETDVTNRFKLQTAIRGERYSDFGSTLTGKLAGSYKVNDSVMLRGSLSSGFRAPSLQQVYFSSTFTDFVPEQVNVVLAPNGGTLANAAGIPKLKEETSKNYTLGLTFKPSNTFSVTADLYRIDISDRIVLSGRFDSSFLPLKDALAALGVGQAQFFVNSVNTKTQGLDLTASHKMDLGAGKLSTYLGFNYSKTEVTKVKAPPSLIGFEDVLLSERERLFIEQGGPRMKATLALDYSQGPWAGNVTVIHFGEQTLGTWTGTAGPDGIPNSYYAPKTSADTSLTYAFNDKTKLTIGANNIFNVKPSRQNPGETDNGFIYDSVQFGLNGTSYFARIWKKF